MQDGHSLVMIAKKFTHCDPFMKNWLLILVLVEHMSASLYPDPERLVPMKST